MNGFKWLTYDFRHLKSYNAFSLRQDLMKYTESDIGCRGKEVIEVISKELYTYSCLHQTIS